MNGINMSTITYTAVSDNVLTLLWSTGLESEDDA